MKVCTIGFKGKSARDFFTALKAANVQKLIDIRRNNTSQLAGFTKAKDLQFFLEDCFGIVYEHVPDFAPSAELLGEYKKRLGKKKMDDAAWAFYTDAFTREIEARPIVDIFRRAANSFDTVCLLCSEPTPQHCHRRLIAEYIKEKWESIQIEHL